MYWCNYAGMNIVVIDMLVVFAPNKTIVNCNEKEAEGR